MSILSQVTKGRVSKPPLALFYGPDGVGKTALAAGAPSPLFLGAEQGSDHLDVARLPIASIDGLTSALSALAQPQEEYKTAVVDTLDWLETMIQKHVIAKHGRSGWTSIEEFGFGKGRVHCLEVWKELIPMFDAVRAAGVGVVFLAHSMIKKFEDPSTPQGYERYQLKLQSGAQTDVAALLREYVDTVGFLNFETLTTTDDKRRAFEGAGRILHTQRTPAYDAKNRLGLPAKIEIPDDPAGAGLGWQAFDEAVKAAQSRPSTDTSELEKEVNALLEQVTDKAVLAAARPQVAKAKGNEKELNRLKTKLTAIISKGKEKN